VAEIVWTIRNISPSATVVVEAIDIERKGFINGRTSKVLVPDDSITVPDYEFRMWPDAALIKLAGMITRGLVKVYKDAAEQTDTAVAKYGVMYRFNPT